MTPPLSAKAWRVVNVQEHRDAVQLIEELHYAKGAPNTSTYRHGLYTIKGNRLWGVALWLPPTKNAAVTVAGDDWRGVLCLSRLVVHPNVQKNGASFLLGRSMRMIDRGRWPWLLTYADTRLGHTGAIYKATNWKCLGEVPAGDTWIGPDGEQRGRKRGGRNLSAAEMRTAGFERAPAMPKIKYVHGVLS